MSYRFKPTFWASIFTLLSCVILTGLGTWQIQRLEWKQGILQQIADRQAMPAKDIKDINITATDINYTPAMAQGQFLKEREMYLTPRMYDEKQGVHIIAPLVIQGTDQVLLVNRGWVEKGKEANAKPPKGTTTITGKLHGAFATNMFTPENRPDQNQWYFIDIPAMAKYIDVSKDKIYPVVLFENKSETDPKTQPIGGQLIIDIPNNHFQYALFWFSMMGILLVIYVLYHIKREDKNNR